VTTRENLRRGFTAIELLIVVSIIALLAALTAGAVFRTLRVQEGGATDAALVRLGSGVESQWRVVAEAAKSEYEGLPAEVKQSLLVLADTGAPGAGAMPSPHPRRDERARLLYVKYRQKKEFPTSFYDAIDPAPVTAVGNLTLKFLPTQTVANLKVLPTNYPFTGRPEYVRFVDDFLFNNNVRGALRTGAQMRQVLSGVPSPVYQSSILLTLAFDQVRGGAPRTPVEDLVSSTYVVSAGRDEPLARQGRAVQLPRYLKDVWDRPVQFYAFPAYSYSGSNGQSTPDLEATVVFGNNQTLADALRTQVADPQDPDGLMVPPLGPAQPFSGWRPAANLVALLPHPLVAPQPNIRAGRGAEYKMRRMQPVVVSAGQDGDLGGNPAAVDPTMALPGAGSQDNHYSFRLRQVGARGD